MTEATTAPKPAPAVKADPAVNTATEFNVGRTAATVVVSPLVKVGDAVDLVRDGKTYGKGKVTDVLTGTWPQLRPFASDVHAFARFPAAEAQALCFDTIKGAIEGFDAVKGKVSFVYVNRTA